MTIGATRVPGWLQTPPHLAGNRHIWHSCTGESIQEGRGVGGESSTLPLGVVDPAASYRSGLSAALSTAGFAPTELTDPRAWASTAGRRVLLWTVRAAQDWKELRALRGLNPELVLVALLVDPTPEAYAEALRSGAVAAAAWEAVPEAIVKVLAAALEGDSLIPAGVAQALAAKLPAFEDPDWITHEELGWLRILAQGGTVQELAGQAGYSERALYRLLHTLYSRMGVSNRTEAILQASRRGLLD
jgi:DNA-binding NarL/FixJ family response regulator